MCHILGKESGAAVLSRVLKTNLDEHVLFLGNHVHVLLKVLATEVHGLYQYVLISTDLYGGGIGREGGRECVCACVCVCVCEGDI